MARLELKNVSKTYGRSDAAVKDIDLSLGDEEFTVVVGPSGSGKSTLLRMIAGLETVTSGEILIDGRCVNSLAASDRNVAMVFQDSVLYPHMSVSENLSFSMRMRGVAKSEIARRVQSTAAMLGVERLLDRKPGELSGGEAQRVAVGRAVLREPGVLLFDEPLSNLDGPLRTSLRREIHALQRRLGATMMYVTHDPEEAMLLADRVIVMRDGRVQQIGPPQDVYHRSANRFVADFFRVERMSFLDGVLVRSAQGLQFREEGSEGASIELAGMRMKDESSGCAVVAGIGPWSLSRADGKTDAESNVIAITVERTEWLGSWVDVVGRTPGGQAITVRLTAREASGCSGQLRLRVDMDAVQFFEPGENGMRIDIERG